MYWEIMNLMPLVKTQTEAMATKQTNLQLRFARTIIPKLRAAHHTTSRNA